MKITKKHLEALIQEELEKELEEGVFGDFIKKGVDKLKTRFSPKPKPGPSQDGPTGGLPGDEKDKEAEEGEDVDLSDLDGPQNPEDAQPDSTQVSPQASKARDLFIDTARQFFNSNVRGKMRDQIMKMLSGNLSADSERLARAKKKRGLAEQVTANTPRGQALVIANAIMANVEKLLKSITPEEFAKVFAEVAQTNLKDDPKALKQALKSYRMAENMDKLSNSQIQAGLQVSSTFSQQLQKLMKLKGVNAAKLVKDSFMSIPPEKMGMNAQQKNMLMGKMIGVLSKSLSNYFAGKTDNLKPTPSSIDLGPDTSSAKKEVPAPVDLGENKKSANTKLLTNESRRFQKLAGILKD